jgi:tetratricopeptide (TPR) repeat protein
MARADRRRSVREARRVQRRPRAHAGGAPMVEDTMFFPKLRAHAKWVFVLLAVVFASSFIFLGVGSGSSGIGDLLQGNWSDIFGGGGGGSSAQVKKDQKLIDANPKDYAAYKDLATAQAADGKLDDAIATLQKLKSLQPKDVDALTQLAGLYLQKANVARDEAIVVQNETQTVVSPSTFAPGGTSPLAKAYQGFKAPVVDAIQTQANEKLNAAYSKLTTAYSNAVVAYKDVAKASPNDPSVQFALAQTAEQAQDSTTAIAAYKRFLKLAPEDPTAPAIRQRLKQLKQAQQQQPSVSTG